MTNGNLPPENRAMKKPFYTVVIPLYNKEQSVKRALSSVLSQQFGCFEVLVVNDGSTDRSAEVVSGFDDPRLSLIKQPNRGPSSARNRGVKAASSEYVCFLDADDAWDSGFLETMSSLIAEAPQASLYSVKYRVVDEHGRVFHHRSDFPDAYLGYVDDFFKSYEIRGLINSSSVCIRKEALQKIGGFPENARFGEDIYTWLRLADINRVAYANIEHVTIFRNAENRSGASERQEIPYHIKAVLGGGAKEFTKENRNKIIRFVAKNIILHAAGAVLKGDRSAAFMMAWMLWGISRRRSGQVLCVAITPRPLLRALKRLKNRGVP